MLVLAVALAYVLAGIPLFRAFGDEMADIAYLVVAVAGALLGLRGGLIAAALAPAVNLLLLAVVASTSWDAAINGPHLLIAFAVGGGFGALRDLGARSIEQDRLRSVAGDEARRYEQRLSTVVANAPIVVTTFDREGTYTLSAGRGLAALGLEAGERVGRSVFDVYREAPDILANIRRGLAGDEFSATLAAGPATFDARFMPTRDERGEVTGLTVVAVDVTERVRAQEAADRALAVSERRRAEAEALAEAAGVLASGAAAGETLPAILRSALRVVPADAAGLVALRDGAFEIVAATGLADGWVGRRFAEPEGIWGRVIRTGRAQIVPEVEADADALGWVREVRSVRSVLSIPATGPTGSVAVLQLASSEAGRFGEDHAQLLGEFGPYVAAALEGDRRLGEIREKEESLDEKERQLAFVVRHLPIHLFALDAHGVFTLSEGSAAPPFGDRSRELVGRSAFDAWRELPESLDRIRRALSGKDVLEDGEREGRIFQVRLAPIREDGAVTSVIGVGLDVTERRRAERELERLALHDRLTGLPNRALVQDRLEQALVSARRLGTSVALLSLNVGPLQDVNDTYGYEVGDALIREIGPRIARLLRETDTLGRVGDDEFVIVLPGADADGAVGVVRKVLTAVREPFLVEGHELYPRTKIGTAVSPPHGDDAAELLRRAGLAMSAAGQGDLGYAAYVPEHDKHPARVALMSDLRRAIDRDELILHYQPVVRLASSAAVQLEALLRWRHPERGWIPPAELIPAAEEAGLMRRLTDRVLRTALPQCRTWQERGLDLGVAVNVSARNLLDPEFPGRLAASLAAAGVEPARLTLEITESVLMADRERARATILRLREFGVAVEIDDFGTGYSSLAYLSRLPVSALKIDQAFVKPMLTDESCAEIVRATIQLAHTLGFPVVAEGVEDAATLEELKRLSCDYAQGYLLGRPMALPDLERWLGTAGAEGGPRRTGGSGVGHGPAPSGQPSVLGA